MHHCNPTQFLVACTQPQEQLAKQGKLVELREALRKSSVAVAMEQVWEVQLVCPVFGLFRVCVMSWDVW